MNNLYYLPDSILLKLFKKYNVKSVETLKLVLSESDRIKYNTLCYYINKKK